MGAAGRRPYDAQASREALLDAARTLFETRGYDATTIRDIGARSRVDPALIARYFGSKEGLYLAAISQAGPAALGGGDPLEFVERVLSRQEARGIGPVARAAVSPTLSETVSRQVRDILAARAVEPIASTLRERGVAEPELRASIVVATAVGLSLAREGGALPAVSRASTAELVEAMVPAIRALTEDAA